MRIEIDLCVTGGAPVFAVLRGVPQPYLHRPKFNAPHRMTVRYSE
jgi:hypothetical protein